MLSSRSTIILKGSHNYISKQFELMNNTPAYNDIDNKNGSILMSIAENKLCSELLLHRIENHKKLTTNILNYNDSTGTSSFRLKLSQFLSLYIFKNCTINPDHLIVSSGNKLLYVYMYSVSLSM